MRVLMALNQAAPFEDEHLSSVCCFYVIAMLRHFCRLNETMSLSQFVNYGGKQFEDNTRSAVRKAKQLSGFKIDFRIS
jgi:hypothetical protein